MPDTKPDCKYYNWNDNPDYPSYPKEYGARCERYKLFFRETNGRLLPDCRECREYKKKMEINEGSEKKGGQNKPPTTPKPRFNPPPQKPQRNDRHGELTCQDVH